MEGKGSGYKCSWCGHRKETIFNAGKKQICETCKKKHPRVSITGEAETNDRSGPINKKKENKKDLILKKGSEVKKVNKPTKNLKKEVPKSAATIKKGEEETVASPKWKLQLIDIAKIKICDFNGRLKPKETLDGLRTSIGQEGLINPIGVKKTGKDNYEVVDGSRRFMVIKEDGQSKKIFVRVYEDLSNIQAFQIHKAENTERQAMSSIEDASEIKKIMDKDKYTVKELSAEINMKEKTLYATLELLKLPDKVRTKVHKGMLAPSTARKLGTLFKKNSIDFEWVLKKTIDEENEALPRKQVEALVDFVMDSDGYEKLPDIMKKMIKEDRNITPTHLQVACLTYEKLPDAIKQVVNDVSEKEKIELAKEIQKKIMTVPDAIKLVKEAVLARKEQSSTINKEEEDENIEFKKIIKSLKSIIKFFGADTLDQVCNLSDEELDDVIMTIDDVSKVFKNFKEKIALNKGKREAIKNGNETGFSG